MLLWLPYYVVLMRESSNWLVNWLKEIASSRSTLRKKAMTSCDMKTRLVCTSMTCKDIWINMVGCMYVMAGCSKWWAYQKCIKDAVFFVLPLNPHRHLTLWRSDRLLLPQRFGVPIFLDHIGVYPLCLWRSPLVLSVVSLLVFLLFWCCGRIW